MKAATIFALVFLSVALLTANGARGGEASGSTLQRLTTEWAHINSYSMTVETTEWTRGQSVQEVLHYAFRKPDRARLEVVAGSKRGSVLIWRGGDRVVAYHRGFSIVRIAAGVKSGNVTSSRGNGILTPNLGDVLDCFASRREQVRESAGPIIGDEPTDAVALEYSKGGSTCPDDSTQDQAVTRDVLYVSRASGYVVERERYEGDALVERYLIHDLSIDSDLPDSLFH
jgi:outer membrane lipoprotein-sorting protein